VAAQKRFIAAHGVFAHTAFAWFKAEQPVHEPEFRPVRQQTQSFLQRIIHSLPGKGAALRRPGRRSAPTLPIL
jgi:hypothetical protein